MNRRLMLVTDFLFFNEDETPFKHILNCLLGVVPYDEKAKVSEINKHFEITEFDEQITVKVNVREVTNGKLYILPLISRESSILMKQILSVYSDKEVIVLYEIQNSVTGRKVLELI